MEEKSNIVNKNNGIIVVESPEKRKEMVQSPMRSIDEDSQNENEQNHNQSNEEPENNDEQDVQQHISTSQEILHIDTSESQNQEEESKNYEKISLQSPDIKDKDKNDDLDKIDEPVNNQDDVKIEENKKNFDEDDKPKERGLSMNEVLEQERLNEIEQNK